MKHYQERMELLKPFLGKDEKLPPLKGVRSSDSGEDGVCLPDDVPTKVQAKPTLPKKQP